METGLLARQPVSGKPQCNHLWYGTTGNRTGRMRDRESKKESERESREKGMRDRESERRS